MASWYDYESALGSLKTHKKRTIYFIKKIFKFSEQSNQIAQQNKI
jgi:hypothetical protein